MIFRFGNFSLDPDRRELRSGGKLVNLQPLVFDLILYLVHHRDRVVGKDELFDRLWPGVVVVEGALQRAVSIARSRLRAGGSENCIKTHARKGYRFVAPVSEETVSARAAPGGAGAATVQAKPSIVVLPFDNLSDDRDQGFFAEGMAEDISTALSRLRCLVVISRASGAAYRDEAPDYDRVAEELGARYILTGSVRRVADHLRVNAKLVDARTHTQIWSERFDRQTHNLFEIQDDITGTIVAKIEPEFSQFEREQARTNPPSSLDAWGTYQRGIWHLYRFTRADTAASLPLFERAISLDPQFAPAYAGVSFNHFSNAYLGYADDFQREVDLARETAQQGVGVDNRCPAAHWALGRALLLSRDLDASIAELETSVELNPNYAHAWYMLGWALVLAGKPRAALERLQKAEMLSPRDPLLFAFRSVRAMALLLDGDRELALQSSEMSVRQPNSHQHTLAIHLAALDANNSADKARAVARKILGTIPEYDCAAFGRAMPYRENSDLLTFTGPLARAGIPEVSGG